MPTKDACKPDNEALLKMVEGHHSSTPAQSGLKEGSEIKDESLEQLAGSDKYSPWICRMLSGSIKRTLTEITLSNGKYFNMDGSELKSTPALVDQRIIPDLPACFHLLDKIYQSAPEGATAFMVQEIPENRSYAVTYWNLANERHL